jgi:hypothetical protein
MAILIHSAATSLRGARRPSRSSAKALRGALPVAPAPVYSKMPTADPLSRLGWTDHHVGIDEAVLVRQPLLRQHRLRGSRMGLWETRSTIAYL